MVRSTLPHTTETTPPILSDVLPLESDFLIPTGTLIVLLVILTMLVVLGVSIALLIRFLVVRRDTAPRGQTGSDPSRP